MMNKFVGSFNTGGGGPQLEEQEEQGGWSEVKGDALNLYAVRVGSHGSRVRSPTHVLKS